MSFALVSALVLTELEQVRRMGRTRFLCLLVLASVTGVYAMMETAVPLSRNTRISPAILLILIRLVADVTSWKNRETVRVRSSIQITESEDKRDKDGDAEEHVRGIAKVCRVLDVFSGVFV